jgi:hypothetical protein
MAGFIHLYHHLLLGKPRRDPPFARHLGAHRANLVLGRGHVDLSRDPGPWYVNGQPHLPGGTVPGRTDWA